MRGKGEVLCKSRGSIVGTQSQPGDAKRKQEGGKGKVTPALWHQALVQCLHKRGRQGWNPRLSSFLALRTGFLGRRVKSMAGMQGPEGETGGGRAREDPSWRGWLHQKHGEELCWVCQPCVHCPGHAMSAPSTALCPSTTCVRRATALGTHGPLYPPLCSADRLGSCPLSSWLLCLR